MKRPPPKTSAQPHPCSLVPAMALALLLGLEGQALAVDSGLDAAAHAPAGAPAAAGASARGGDPADPAPRPSGGALARGEEAAAAEDFAARWQELWDAGDLWGAYDLCEARVREADGDGEAWFRFARVLLAIVRSGKADNAALLLVDARNAARKAMRLLPSSDGAVRAAIDVFREAGEWNEAAALAERLLGMRLAGGAGEDGRGETAARPDAEALGLICDLRVQQAMRTPAGDLAAFAARVASVEALLRRAEALRPDAPDWALPAATFHEFLGLPRRASGDLVRGLLADPSSLDLHEKLLDLHSRHRVVDRLPAIDARLAAAAPGSATVLWYQAYTWLVLGEWARWDLRFGEGEAPFLRAIEGMRQAAAIEPGFADSARRMAYRARLGLGWCALGLGELDRAGTLFLEAFGGDPDLRDEPDGLGRTVMDGFGVLGGKHNDRRDFAAAAALARRVVAIQPESAEWWNNLGFFLRELGSQVAAGVVDPQASGAVDLPAAGAALPPAAGADASPDDAARAIYRRSWDAYLRASELAPDDPRIINDTALIQVYHLGDELERAEAMLHRAIEIGQAKLEALGPDPAEEERFPLAQAVGDAWQNLGYLAYHRHDKPAEARAFFERSIASNSGDRGELQAYLDAIDGKREPVEPRRPAAMPPAPAPGLPAIRWECSLDDALARARREHRAVFVYHRGAGLGLAVPFLDAFLARDALARGIGAFVPVVADTQRHAWADRRVDGRRLLCPHFGRVTCGEHTRAAEAFAALWSKLHAGATPGESEEGYFLVAPDGSSIRPLGEAWFGRVMGGGDPEARAPREALASLDAWLEGLGAPLPPPDLDAREARLREPEAPAEDAAARRREAAATLVALPDAAARERAEQILRDVTASPRARTALLEEVARRLGAEDGSLLAALATQDQDPWLARAALDVWPEGGAAAPLHRAASWGATAEVRHAAIAALARTRPGDETARWLTAVSIAGDPGDREVARAADYLR